MWSVSGLGREVVCCRLGAVGVLCYCDCACLDHVLLLLGVMLLGAAGVIGTEFAIFITLRQRLIVESCV